MLPTVCRCCGAAIEVRATDNPNVCQACANSDALFWEDKDFALPAVNTRAVASRELLAARVAEAEHFLELEGPSVVECFEAVEQAKRAIAESLAEEAAAAAPLQGKPVQSV